MSTKPNITKKTTNKKEKTCKCKPLEQLSWRTDENLTKQTSVLVLNYLTEKYGLDQLSRSVRGSWDCNIVEGVMNSELDKFTATLTVTDPGDIIHAYSVRIKEISLSNSLSERKGIRGGMIIVISHLTSSKDEKEASKETIIKYESIFPAESILELAQDVIGMMVTAMCDERKNYVYDYNEKLEKKGSCGCKAK